MNKIYRRFADQTGAITMEYVFNSLIGIAVAGVLFFFIKSPAFAAILSSNITDFISNAVGSLFHW
jgi:hypothetical protein